MLLLDEAIEEARQILSLFLYSINHYDRTINQLSVSEGLRRFDGSSSTVEFALASFDSDCVAIDVRLMLQRKYFSRSDKVRLKKLIEAAQIASIVDEADANKLCSQLISLNSRPIEISLSGGTTISGQYANVEDATYGSLLHADLDRSLRLVRFPQEMRLLSLAPYILAREDLLHDFRDLCLGVELEPLNENLTENEPILRWCETSKSERAIKKSPYWSNVAGRDLDEGEFEIITSNNTLDDNTAIAIASLFFELLLDHSLNISKLQKMVREESLGDWGDFEQAAGIARAIESPGVSTHVMHMGGEDSVQVKFLPHVNSAWITETPQLLRNTGCLICLTKQKGVWKVNRIL